MRCALLLMLLMLSPVATVAEGLRPLARPATLDAAEMAALTPPVPPTITDVAPVEPPAVGPETGLPLPRYVSTTDDETNVRRGPGGDHRIDWVFARKGLPLRVTAEYGNWRRVEDAQGEGGWVLYALLSGTRTALVTVDTSIRRRPDGSSMEVARVEAGVIGRLLECEPDWCRVEAGEYRGWAPKDALWGVDPEEAFE